MDVTKRTLNNPAPARRRVLLLDCEALEPLTRLAAPFEAQVMDWPGLTETAQLAAPSTVVVIDPFARRGPPKLDPQIPALLAAARMLPVVALFRSGPGTPAPPARCWTGE